MALSAENPSIAWSGAGCVGFVSNRMGSDRSRHVKAGFDLAAPADDKIREERLDMLGRHVAWVNPEARRLAVKAEESLDPPCV